MGLRNNFFLWKIAKKKKKFPCDPAPDDFLIFQQSAINYSETEIDSLVIVNDNVID